MTEEDVTRAIIKPMRRLYPAPRHLRADEDELDAALREYRRALGRFDQDVLKRAWERVVAEHQIWCWPKVGVFVKAAVQAHREMHPPGAVEPWVEEATKLADAYVRKFMKTSQAAVRAREGGFEAELRQYVTEASWVQAQMVIRRSDDIGFSSGVLFGGGPQRDREAEKEWFARQKEQAATGAIKVTVPRELIKGWQAEGQARSR